MVGYEITSKPEMPLRVEIAVILFVITLVIGLVRAWLQPAPVELDMPILFIPLVAIISFILLAILVCLIATGRRWAVILSLLLFLLGLPSTVFVLGMQSVSEIVVSSIQLLFQVTAYTLLFTKESRRWFAESRAYREGERTTVNPQAVKTKEKIYKSYIPKDSLPSDNNQKDCKNTTISTERVKTKPSEGWRRTKLLFGVLYAAAWVPFYWFKDGNESYFMVLMIVTTLLLAYVISIMIYDVICWIIDGFKIDKSNQKE